MPPQKVVPMVVQPRGPKSAICVSETPVQKLRSSAQALPRPKFGEDSGYKTKATVAIAHTQPRALPTPTRAPRPQKPNSHDLEARYQSAGWTASLSSKSASIPIQGQACHGNLGHKARVRSGHLGRGPLPALNYGPAAQSQVVSAQSHGQPSRVAPSSREQSLHKAAGGLQHGHGRSARDDPNRDLKMHVSSLLSGPVPTERM